MHLDAKRGWLVSKFLNVPALKDLKENEKGEVNMCTAIEEMLVEREEQGIEQGIPIGGYNRIIEKMLEGVEVRTGVDFFEFRKEQADVAEKIIFTGMIDEYFEYRLGALEYRSVRFETEVLDCDNYQGNAVVNYTEREVPYTRIIEHKHFEFGQQEKTVISREYSSEWKVGMEPYYPVNDEKNTRLFEKYQELAKAEGNVIFGGRLGDYKYYDMDKVIEAALNRLETME